MSTYYGWTAVLPFVCTLHCSICHVRILYNFFFFFQAEDGIRDLTVTGVQTCALPIYEAGLIHLQSLPAMVTCQVLDPKPDEVIVDLNCAPAGKMSYLCQLTKNKARIIGFDRNEEKIGKAGEHLERLRCENYQLIAHDSRYAHLDYKFNADKVLVDPPCTGLGVMPKLSIETTKKDIENLSSYQKQFMTTAAALVKEGGTVVYSVCTVTGEECEEVARFAEEKLGLKKVAANPIVGRGGLDVEKLTQRFDPELDGAGYFIAKFVKR